MKKRIAYAVVSNSKHIESGHQVVECVRYKLKKAKKFIKKAEKGAVAYEFRIVKTKIK